jgi:pyruvate,water dikinase
MDWVVPLAGVGRGDVAAVGGKAACLGELTRNGLPVPPGFCVTAAALRLHLRTGGLGERLHARLAECDVRDPGQRATAATDIGDWIRGTPPPAAVADAVIAAYTGLGPGVAVAVRSSGVAEDLPSASFAGQHETSLGVSGAIQVVEAVVACWASPWGERAIAYRLEHGHPVDDVALACLVQVMVPAEWAGVAFTADPSTGRRDRVVVDVVAGLGESLVAGRATADHYVLTKHDGALVGSRSRAASPPEFLPELVRLSVRVEGVFGVPQDVEWAVAGGGLHVLQARPITRLKPEPIPVAEAERPLLVYPERIREMIPSAITPLTAEVATRVILPFMIESFVHHGFLPRRLAARALSAHRLVHGRLYLDASLFRVSFLPGLDELAIIDLLERGHRPPLRAVRPSLLLSMLVRLPRMLFKVVRMMGRLDRMTEDAVTILDRLVRPLESQDLRAWDRPRVLALLRLEPSPDFRRALIESPPANALARLFSTPGYAALRRMVTRWADEPPESAGRLLSGLSGLVEVDCAAALWDLAEAARRVPSVRGALEAHPEVALEALRGDPSAASWLEGFAGFLARFGHRGIEEVELARPRWREQPAYPLTVIANYLGSSPEAAPGAVEARCRAERQAIEARIGRRLRFHPFRRWAFRTTLDIVRKSGPAGENTKSAIVRLLMLQRRAALELGRRLVADGRLDRADDVFFLLFEELEDAGNDLRDRVAVRRSDHDRWQRADAPRVIDARERPVLEGMPSEAEAEPGVLAGVGSSPGLARGRVRVVRDPSSGLRLRPGEVLVAPYTDPAWTPLFLTAAAVVVEVGSLLSHASIVARELGLPSVVAVPGATEALRDGDEVEVDGTRGTVRRPDARPVRS